MLENHEGLLVGDALLATPFFSLTEPPLSLVKPGRGGICLGSVPFVLGAGSAWPFVSCASLTGLEAGESRGDWSGGAGKVDRRVGCARSAILDAVLASPA